MSGRCKKPCFDSMYTVSGSRHNAQEGDQQSVDAPPIPVYAGLHGSACWRGHRDLFFSLRLPEK